MMGLIALYAAATFGLATGPVLGADQYTWMLAWGDGLHETYTTTGPILRDVPSRDGRCFTSTVCASSGGGPEACSSPSDLYCVNPLVGDLDLNGVVGAQDFILFGQHFGQRVP